MIRTIGVIGAGQMGNGIAHVAALHGYNVKLVDVDVYQIDQAKETIDQNMGRQVKRGVITDAERKAALARIEGQIAFETMLRRLPELALAPGPLVWRSNLGLRGLTQLPLTFARTA